MLSTSVHEAKSCSKEVHEFIGSLTQMDADTFNRSGLSGQSANGLASAISGLVQSTRGILADQSGLDLNSNGAPMDLSRRQLIQDVRKAVQLAYELVRAAKDARISCESNQQSNVATILSHSHPLNSQLQEVLNKCLGGLPGYREINEANYLIEQRRSQLIECVRPDQNRLSTRFVQEDEYQRKQTDLTQTAVEFNQVRMIKI